MFIMQNNRQTVQVISRNRLLLLVCTLAVIVLGLASRRYPVLFPEFLGKYPGDVLWSLMLYYGWAFLKPSSPANRIALFTLVTASLVEVSQLIQVSWLNTIRHTTIGHLVLGTVFSWYDIFAYTIGVILGLYCDSLIIDRVQLKKLAT